MSFNVGDVVQVTKRGVSWDENGMGKGYKWDNRWCASMDEFVGGYYKITAYDQELGYQLAGHNFFPENVLRK